MKAGTVTSIRINPRDCQSCLDVLDTVGVPRNALSFAQIVSLTLSSLLETARNQNLIPEPDEFAYLDRMTPYLGPRRLKRKGKIANELNNLGGRLRPPGLLPDRGEPDHPAQVFRETAGPAPTARPATADPETLRAAQMRLTELLQKKEMAEDEIEGVLWSGHDQVEFDTCYKIVYPEG